MEFPTSMTKTPTTEMEVTSIRLERELKNKLKELAGDRGYQSLVRDVLWNYVQQRDGVAPARVRREDIRACIPATAQGTERCAMTGRAIAPGEAMLLGWTAEGGFVPLDCESLVAG